MVIDLRYYQTATGAQPFAEWLGALADRQARARIRARLARVGNQMVLLLCGGDKRTQQRDIKRAKEYFKDYEKRAAQERGA